MPDSSLPLTVKSFAKLNLYLQVLNKRKDNFHNLSTLFARIDLADTIIFSQRQDSLIKIRCASRQVPKDKTNLCYRAAALLKQKLKLSSGIEIEIKKCIPVGAGLGGGSANAASVLWGLNKFWKLNLPVVRLAAWGAELGSDVPFFIYNTKFALGSGRGDKIKPVASLNKLKLWFILVCPKIKVSTPIIYRKYDTCLPVGQVASGVVLKPAVGLTRPRCNVKILVSELLKKGKAARVDCFYNGLEAVTRNLYPVVNQVKKALSSMGLEKIIMSGSGPAVFGICDGRKQAQDLKHKLIKRYKSWRVFVISTL